MTLFSVTNTVGGYSYVPLDCKIKQEFRYFSKENPFDLFSERFTDEKSLKLLTDCFKNNHPAVFQ